MMPPPCIMIIAGEASGDLHGANLVSAMKTKDPSLFFYGIGGNRLKNAGVRILVDSSEIAVIGISEVFSKLSGILKAQSLANTLLRSLHPDLLILIDFPDFNLHIAQTAKRLKIPVLYYISPQIWAWRQNRVHTIGKRVDHIAVILPFEEAFYQKHGIPVTFVGHPLLDQKAESRTQQAESREDIVIGLLPGSRDGELKRHLPVMLEAAEILNRDYNTLRFLVSLSPSVERSRMESILAQHHGTARFDIVEGGASHVFHQATLAVAASGTVTLEAAISGTPVIVIYKVSPISYQIGKALIRVKHISLINLIAGKTLVPELIQDKASPDIIARTVSEMLANPSGLDRLRHELLDLKNRLGGPGASERVAEIAMRMLYQKNCQLHVKTNT